LTTGHGFSAPGPALSPYPSRSTSITTATRTHALPRLMISARYHCRCAIITKAQPSRPRMRRALPWVNCSRHRKLSRCLGVIGILLPMLTRARKSSSQVVCASTCGNGASRSKMYAQENHGYLPRRGGGGGRAVVRRPCSLMAGSDWVQCCAVAEPTTYSDMAAARHHSAPRAGRGSVCFAEAVCSSRRRLWAIRHAHGLRSKNGLQNTEMPDRSPGIGQAPQWSCSPMGRGTIVPYSIAFPMVTTPRPPQQNRPTLFIDGQVAHTQRIHRQ